jgi:PilZ domain
VSLTADHRIRVSTKTHVQTDEGKHDVTVVALSARSALLFCGREIGVAGGVVDLILPSLAGRDLRVTAGIEKSERIKEGAAVTVHFIVADQELRKALNELLALLLAGTGGGSRKHPRVIYDVRVRVDGGTAEAPISDRARLEEISLSGGCIVTKALLGPSAPIVVHVPLLNGGSALRLGARVVEQKPEPDGGFRTGIAFDTLEGEPRLALGRLLADLMCR